ncbi:MAG: reverse transcriptase [Alphaproteobacteria bacterium]|nr:reverse transcriptase [Alphaproteobacteria bacterium]
MKTYKNLWDKFISMENLELAAKKAVKSKKSKAMVQQFLANKTELLQKLQQDLINGNFRTSKYVVFTIFEPKERQIYMLPLYPDHVVQHALINVLGPIWHKMFIRDSYACIPGRGLHAGSRRVMHFIRRNKYVLQCDIRKFFPSINHDIMMKIIKRKINDNRIICLMENIVRSGGNGINLPIGNLTSQWLGNVYLNELDAFVKYRLRWRDYIRYCDDFCLFGNDKKQLHVLAKQLENFVQENLDLVFSKCNVAPVSYGVNFIGYRHFPKFILMRKRGKYRIKQRLGNIWKYNDHSHRACSQIAAAAGWLKWACSFNFRKWVMDQWGFLISVNLNPKFAFCGGRGVVPLC